MPWMTEDGRRIEGDPPGGWGQNPNGTWSQGGGPNGPSGPVPGQPGGPPAYNLDANGQGGSSTVNGVSGQGATPPPLEITANLGGPTPESQAQEALNNHFQYGGQAGGAAAASKYFQGAAENSQQRQGEQINYGLAQGYNNQAQTNARGQGRVADMAMARAQGLVPSIAQMQGDRQTAQLNAAQSSAAASARGPAAMALAQQGAAGNMAQGQSQISNSVQINAAQERQQAEQAAFGMYSGMRGQDAQFMGQQADMAQKQAAINAAQRAANDQYSLGLYGNQTDINKAQLQAQGNQITGQQQQQNAAAALAQQQGQYDSSRLDKYIGYGLGAAGTLAGVGAMAYFGGGTQGGQGAPQPGGGPPNTGFGADQFGEQGYSGSMAGYDPNDPNNTSDVTAKQNIRPLQAAAWDEGRKAALADMQKLASRSGGELKAYGDEPMAAAIRNMRANAWDEGHSAPQGAPVDPHMAQAQSMMQSTDAQRQGLMGNGPAVGGDPVTAQFAQGLAPSSYDYKPGYPGTSPGTKVGPMAQNMASNNITGTAVRQDPRTGLLGIDNKDGLKVALGGVGHLAEKQRQTDAAIAELIAKSKQMQQGTDAQREGLMSQGPSVSDRYLNYVRGL